jgi:hypothetical protein
MNPEQPTTTRDAVEGHVGKVKFGQVHDDQADDAQGHGRARFDEADDTEGHGRARFDESDDTAGHGRARLDEADDTQGHGHRNPVAGKGSGQILQPTHPRADEADDVEGHLSGALGSKKKTEHDA